MIVTTAVLLSRSVNGVFGQRVSEEQIVWDVSEDLQVQQIATDVWMHTSWQTIETGVRFPSNGLIVKEGSHVVLVDTAWGDDLTRAVIASLSTFRPAMPTFAQSSVQMVNKSSGIKAKQETGQIRSLGRSPFRYSGLPVDFRKNRDEAHLR